MAKTDPIRAHLMRLDKAALVTLLLKHADEGFLAQLGLEVARQAPGGPDLARFRQSLQGILDDLGCEEGTTSGDLDRFADSLRALMADGHPGAAMELAAEALEGLEQAWDNMDSSDDYMGCVATDLREIHHEACSQIRPDPRELAGWVFRMEMANDYGTFDNLVDEYRPLLGLQGLEQVHRLASEVWDRVPPLGPGNKQAPDYARSNIRRFMLKLTRPDPEAHLAVLERDLSGPMDFLGLAEHCLASGWADRSMAWVEKGLKAFPGNDSSLGSFLADRYAEAGRLGEALALRWALFEARPQLGTYKSLVAVAHRSGETEAWRQRALDLLQDRFEDGRKRPSHWGRQDLDQLVLIHLQEKAPLEALAAARKGGCTQGTWMHLAKGLEPKHPGESLKILQEQLETIIAPMKPEAYQAAVAVLGRIRELALRLQQPGLFTTTLALVMTGHARKKNLVSLIRKAGLA
jgi:hypothetical protein